MLEFPEPLDLTQLIEALKKAQTKTTLKEQRLELELAIVESELNPSSSNFVDLIWAIELVSQINFSNRNWQPAPEQLIDFFD
jgi:dimeric dUTPase (all-alpha-NTP-PPase superfamily)